MDKLIDAWCDRRKLPVLRVILQAYPLATGLTDEWEELRARASADSRIVSG